MLKTLVTYSIFQYGKIITSLLVERFQKDYPYMDGYGLAVLVPDKIINRESLAPGLLSDYINQGGIVV